MPTLRLALGLLLAGALAACTHARAPEPSVAAATTASPSVAAPLPPATGPGPVNPHDQRGGPTCQRCHGAAGDGKLTRDANSLCAACHRFEHRNHPVDVIQEEGAVDLPLLAGGRVACHSCHDPHDPKAALRKPFNDLCRSCHVGQERR